jgi:hypothetical protein
MWWNHLKSLIALEENSKEFEGFRVISGLKTGEGVVFCPQGLVIGSGDQEDMKIRHFGRGCLVVKVRRKLTVTTGQSILSQKV